MRLTALLLTFAVAACATKPAANLSAPAAVGAVDWTKATPVEVQLDEFHFRPETLRFATARPVSLVLINTGSVEHRFVAPGFFAQSVVKPGGAKPGSDGVTLKPGERVQIDLVSTRADTYDLECTETLHPMLGMTGTIVVTP
ncbi:MAG: hypothetical protein JWM77_2794 [Rhodospirillales bacterium]|jgi:uncharacterized cupredoxin-like copper-binding protein|nr:hypothetical protein [Rhodospirillales bacterium]